MTPQPRGLRVTGLPPADTAEWYSPTRPCRHCRGKLYFRTEHATRVSITVQHQERCPVLKPSQAGKD
jgi:hypothetical protein